MNKAKYNSYLTIRLSDALFLGVENEIMIPPTNLNQKTKNDFEK